MDRCGFEMDDGSTCRRPAGWGMDASIGYCRDHAEHYHHPDKLTPEVQAQLEGIAEVGAKLKECAGVAGISPRTLRRWLDVGESDVEEGITSPLAELFVRFQRARARGAKTLLDQSSPEFILQSSYGYSTRTTTQSLEDEKQWEVSSEVVVVTRE